MITIGQAIDRGIKRKNEPNQDAIGSCLPGLLNKRPPLLVLADGMGGHQEGSRASRMVLDEFIRYYRTSKGKDYPANLSQALEKAHQKLQQYSTKHKDIHKMGTTLVAAVFAKDKAHLINVGDSRAYLINQKEIRQLSYDHSFVGEQVRRGILTPLEAHKHPKRNILTQSVSSDRSKLEPYQTSISLGEGDIILLCSDGLWGTVSESQMQDVVLELSPQKAAEKLVAMANQNQGPDNISVMLVRL